MALELTRAALVLMTLGHGLGPWPRTMAKGQGQGPMAQGHGHGPFRGREPLPKAIAKGNLKTGAAALARKDRT